MLGLFTWLLQRSKRRNAPDPLFQFLKELPTGQLTGGVYYAIRLIRHIHRIKDARKGFWVEGMASEPSPEEREIGYRIIETIEKAENKRLIDIPKPTAEAYGIRLVNELQDSLKERLKYDDSLGRSILQDLRLMH